MRTDVEVTGPEDFVGAFAAVFAKLVRVFIPMPHARRLWMRLGPGRPGLLGGPR
jgi:hypothetical protein